MDFESTKKNLAQKRDLANFISLRTAHPGDDLAIGELLVRSFREAYQKKLPTVMTTAEREIELRDVQSRRRNGIVRVMELGFQVMGTYSLIQSGCALDESWTPDTCTLRCLAIEPRFHSLKLSEQLLADAFAIAKRWRASAICLHVQAGAEGVAKLYRRFGFQRQEGGDKMNFGNLVEGYLLRLDRQC
jgi:ribosomal protein S18 acetylase RimI-like enzyme